MRKALNWLSGEGVEAILCVGDFATLSKDPLRDLELVRNELQLLNDLGIPVLYVWGNRDLELFSAIILLDDALRREAQSLVHEILEMKNLIEVPRDARIKLFDGVYVTRNPLLLNDRTIYLTHYDEVVRSCYLHIEGHVHYGQVSTRRYLNAGFVHRDELHGSEPLDGVVMALHLDPESVLRVVVKPLGSVKPLVCPIHIEEGVFFVPETWRRCPVCYDWARARLSRALPHP